MKIGSEAVTPSQSSQVKLMTWTPTDSTGAQKSRSSHPAETGCCNHDSDERKAERGPDEDRE